MSVQRISSFFISKHSHLCNMYYHLFQKIQFKVDQTKIDVCLFIQCISQVSINLNMPHYLYQKHVLVSPWSLFIPETCTGQSAHSHYLYQKHVLVSQPMGSCHIVDFKVNTLILKQMFVRKLSVIASSLLCRKKGTQKLCSSM